MNEHYYLYAVTWPDCRVGEFGAGVDPRFPVELHCHGRVAALSSRVGLDQFDLSKLQDGTADLPWLSKVAVRHHEITGALAERWPAIPARLGTLFESRESLLAKLERCETLAAEFLQRIGDRQELAAKLYLVDDAHPADTRTAAVDPERGGLGAQYLAAQGRQRDRRRQLEAAARQAVESLEARLHPIADAWRRLHTLPSSLTNRPEKMLWNAAFLLPRELQPAFRIACDEFAADVSDKGFVLETTGPWPVYHFCPSLEPEGPSRALAPAVH